VLANLIGTTGASVLLIRPLLRANRPRERRAHVVVFFILVVSNCGGLLTPLGDPPLFLGFLKGVPFEWTFGLWKPWLLVNGLLLVIFNFWDQSVLDREERERPGSQLEAVMEHAPLRIDGGWNFLFLFGIVATIYGAGRGLGSAGAPWAYGVQEGLMLAVSLAAWLSTPGRLREANRFGFAPIVEVAALFAGIFATMTPALLILNARAAELGLTEPWHYFWVTGVLSSFLDNAPTYLTFLALAQGQGLGADVVGVPHHILIAISLGAVFMGANTYIGNGPNFMVRSIAESRGVKMPGFGGYMAYSGAVLLPVFVLVTLVFFRRG
jgi:Na+/H+ antiporter NhaD/arsenite permease-like protein